MRFQHGDHLDQSLLIRCVRCGHPISLPAGAVVPRGYCGGDQFAASADERGGGQERWSDGDASPERREPGERRL